MVFQHFNLFPHLTVLENLTWARLVRKLPRADAEKAAMTFLEKVHIADQAKKYPGSCPGASSSVSPLPAACACGPSHALR